MKSFYLIFILTTILLTYSCSGSDSNDSPCSASNLNGSCDNGQVCNQGVCVSDAEKCSSQYPNGYCDGGNICQDGTCINKDVCSNSNPNGTCENEAEFCDEGICQTKLKKYKLGTISQTIDENHNLINEFHVDIMDITGRNKHRVTNDVQSCINKDSCWISPNYKYLLYLKDAGNSVYSLNIVDIPDDFNTNFTSSQLITTKLVGQPHFLSDGNSFIYIDNTSGAQMIKKYNMLNKSGSDVAKFSVVKQGQDSEGNPVDYDHPAVNFAVSPDDKTIVFDIIMDYRVENNPTEIWKLDLVNPTNAPVMIYKFNKFNQDGNGLNWAVISQDSQDLAFISGAGLQHRLHLVRMDGSSLVEDGGDPVGAPEGNPLGKYIGPDYNSCSNIEGTQICDMESDLYYSKYGNFLYFAGKVGQYSELSPYINLYKFDILNKNLIKITDENTDFLNAPMQTIIFNIETESAAYTMAQQGYIKNHDASYLDLNSTDADLGNTQITNTRESRELKLFFLK
jgi:hypothetical protein